MLPNYEEELTAQFGADSSLAARLRFPVFIGSFTDEGERTLRRLRAQLPAAFAHLHLRVRRRSRRVGHPGSRYEFRLRVLQELATKDPDALAVHYTRFDDLDEEQRAAVEAIGKKGLVVVRGASAASPGTGASRRPPSGQRVLRYFSCHTSESEKHLGGRQTVHPAIDPGLDV